MSKAVPPGQNRPYRLVVVGTSGVGKTAIIEHLIYGNHVIGKVELRRVYLGAKVVFNIS